jgi:hypothetical protein
MRVVICSRVSGSGDAIVIHPLLVAPAFAFFLTTLITEKKRRKETVPGALRAHCLRYSIPDAI